MSRVSIIVPCRDELYLKQTVEGLLYNAYGDIEVIVIFDGPQAHVLPQDKRIKIITNEKPLGRRQTTNIGVHSSTGKYIMKIDAHCQIGQDYDRILKEDCEDNWIVIPRRYGLDAYNWKLQYGDPVTYMYYVFPYKDPEKPKLASRPWFERMAERNHILIDEDMGFQGSCWFMTRAHWDRIGDMDETGYGTFVDEAEELGLKTQLGPWEGKVMRNKKTWYAHWAKPQMHWQMNGPDYFAWIPKKEWYDGFRYCADFWFHNRWDKRKHDFEWLVEKFWPLPRWPENWRDY